MIPPDQVRAQLDGILASGEFVKAARLSRFLRFVVEKTLAGEGGELKEYLLGVEVFDRSQDFDPRLDPIVRVEARRLRAKLQEYYETSGRNDALRILFQKGGYEPAFELSPQVRVGEKTIVPPPLKRRRFVKIGLIGLAVLIFSLLVWSTASSPTQPLRIVTLPSPDAQSVEFADGLSEALSAELAQNPALEVIAWPVFAAYRRQAGSVEPTPEDTARSLGAEVVLLVSARQSGDRRRVIAHIIRPVTGQKEWARDYERGTADPFAVQRELSRVIAEEIRTVAARIAVEKD